MAAGSLRADRPGESRVDPSPPSSLDGSGAAPLEALLGRASAQLEYARGEIALAAELRARQQEEIELLGHRLRDAEAECLTLREKVDHRDRLLGQIFASRSWRWVQAMRRALGRR